MTTGIFFHNMFVGKSWPVVGDRYRNFPNLLNDLLKEVSTIIMFEPKPAAEDILLKIHTKEHIEREKGKWYYEGARITVGATIEACEKVWKGYVNNAIVFLVAAGHHASRDYAWGGTYLSCIGPALIKLKSLGLKRLVYIDTDSHHGDGDRNVLLGEKEVMHLCFCDQNEDEDNKICIDVGWRTTDEEYLNKVKGILPKVEKFNPELIIHFFGHDTHIDDYGSRGLSDHFFIELASLMKNFADRVCNGRYVILDGGGANVKVAKRIWPEIMKILSKR